MCRSFKCQTLLPKGIGLCILLFATVGFSKVQVYPQPGDLAPSDQYSLTIEQGGVSYPSFVYKTTSRNESDFHKNRLTYLYKSTDPATSSFSTFCFTESVVVRVTKLTGQAVSVRIKPTRFGISARLEGNTAVFSLDRPAKVSVEFNDCVTHSMLVFGDLPEVDVPRQGDPGVKYFGPGIHNIGKVNPVSSNTTIYIAGGAYLLGMFQGNNVSNVTVRGRGVISGEVFPQCKECMEENMIEMTGSDLHLEGVTIAGTPHFVMRFKGGSNHSVQNVKMISWYASTDGIVVGENSLIEDCFIKVNDDHIKLYNPHLTVRNVIIWPYISGSPFQWGYSGNGAYDGHDTHVSNVDVINDGLCTREGNNRGIFCASGGVRTTNYVFENIWIEGPIYRFLKVDGGNLSQVTFKNVFLTQPPDKPNIVKGSPSDYIFTNMIVAAKPVLKASDAFFPSPDLPKNMQFFYEPNSLPKPPVRFREIRQAGSDIHK